jgi:hypothetical protein
MIPTWTIPNYSLPRLPFVDSWFEWMDNLFFGEIEMCHVRTRGRVNLNDALPCLEE